MEEIDFLEQDEQIDMENFVFYISMEDFGVEKENIFVLQQNFFLLGSWNGEENIIDNFYLWFVKKFKICRKKFFF